MDPIKAPLDPKSYKYLKLKNGLQVVMISTLPQSDNCEESCRFDRITTFNKTHLKLNYDPEPQGICGGSWGFASKKVECNEDCKVDTSPPATTTKKVKEDDIACACLTVGIGSFFDPFHRGGMAHFTEHCMFLGSNKYPGPDTLRKMTTKSHGKTNAVTEVMATSFYFHCNKNGFEEILDAFAHGIFDPQLIPEHVMNEKEAVDSEHAMKRTNEPTRVCDFLACLGKKNHPMGTFYWGNNETLAHKDTPKAMKEWHSKYYKANVMTLCVLGPFKFDKIQKMVEFSFGKIPSDDSLKPIEELLKYGDPYKLEKFEKLYHFVPVVDRDWTMISWMLPVEFMQDTSSQPLRYLRMIFETRAPGGLIHYLREQHWAMNIECPVFENDSFSRNPYCAFFKVIIFMTPLGFRERTKIFTAVSSYIEYHKKIGPHKGAFEDMRRMRANAFHFRRWEDSNELTQKVSMNLLFTEPQYVLMKPMLIQTFNKNLIIKALELLDLKKANIIVISRSFEDKNNIEERLRHFKYNKYTIPEEWYSEANSRNFSPFRFPTAALAKKLVIKDIGLLHPHKFIKLEPGEDEKVLYDVSNRMNMTYLPLDQLDKETRQQFTNRLPSAVISVVFVSPRSELKHSYMIKLWIGIMQSLCDTKINSHLGGDVLYSYQIEHAGGGIEFRFEGPSYQLADYATQVLRIFASFCEDFNDEADYKDHKMWSIQEVEATLVDNHEIVTEILDYLLLNLYVSEYQTIAHLKETTFETFKLFTKAFKYKMFIEVYFYGSVSVADTKQIQALLEGLRPKEYKKRLALKDRNVELPLGASVLRIKAPSVNYHTTVVADHYQFGHLSEEEVPVWMYLCIHLKDYLFHQLRFILMLSYNIRVDPWNEQGNFGLTIRVTSNTWKFTTAQVGAKMAEGVAKFYKQILSSRTVFCKEVMNFKKEGDCDLYYETLRFLVGDCMLKTGAETRKLCFRVEGHHPEKKSKTVPSEVENLEKNRAINLLYDVERPEDADSIFITDIYNFKSKLQLRPCDNLN